MGMPSLTVPLNLDFSPAGSAEGNPQHLRLASTACMFLDARIRQAGAWGPACKIKSVVSWAKGKLTEDTKAPGQPPGTYWYDPVSLRRGRLAARGGQRLRSAGVDAYFCITSIVSTV